MSPNDAIKAAALCLRVYIAKQSEAALEVKKAVFAD